MKSEKTKENLYFYVLLIVLIWIDFRLFYSEDYVRGGIMLIVIISFIIHKLMGKK